MAITPEASSLHRITTFASRDASAGYVIHDIAAARTAFDGAIQQLNTREMKLDSLGVFPLQKDAQHLLDETVSLEGKMLKVPPIFRESHIPIFATAGQNIAYISPAGANICRYFHELWRMHETELDADQEVFSGFAILTSYAGL
ncbi:hypothetical protein [Turneriella parva]|uniref:Uncharacterized protein n=1 Tax=Turneriella parva (strain ATCC BAA-1111 / DSM 21527 / NCTC 11395 / H) TaxID=869212 RepID=I4BBD1_TURPD|nr:hypothetical protein [Turneriella parva]AFM14588.1 hypothetical protein Turpa_3954 [Turneriella parva DSM 21527]